MIPIQKKLWQNSRIYSSYSITSNYKKINNHRDAGKEVTDDNKRIYEQWEWLANEFKDETENFEVAVGKMDCTPRDSTGCEKYMKKGKNMWAILCRLRDARHFIFFKTFE